MVWGMFSTPFKNSNSMNITQKQGYWTLVCSFGTKKQLYKHFYGTFFFFIGQIMKKAFWLHNKARCWDWCSSHLEPIVATWIYIKKHTDWAWKCSMSTKKQKNNSINIFMVISSFFIGQMMKKAFWLHNKARCVQHPFNIL